MELELKVLIPLAVLLIFLIIIVIFLICRYYVCASIREKKERYRRISLGTKNSSGYPKMPFLSKLGNTSPTMQQIEANDQFSEYGDISKAERTRHTMQYTDHKGRTSRYEFLPSTDSDVSPFYYSPASSTTSEPSSFSIFPQSAEKSYGSERSYSTSGSLTKKHRGKFTSEPSLNDGYSEDNEKPVSLHDKRRRFSASKNPKRRKSSTCAQIVSSVGGQIEFCLYYNAEKRSLNITVNQLLDLTLRPENFLSVLEVYERHERPKSNKVHLRKTLDGNFELSDFSNMVFLVYVTLLPKRTFSKHTNVVFGTGNVVFNEKFSITGYSTEQLAAFQLCFHALCKFGRDGEPIVLGEIRVPLKRIQVSQNLPFMANLGPPTEVLEIENYLKPSTDLGYLDIFISFNPIAQKLIVKIVQATGLPKVGVTGHPNVAVKTSLYYCNTRMNKKTTAIKKRARDPVYNSTFEFELSKDKILDCDLLFEVRHHGPMYRTVIGYVTIGNGARGDGAKHWKALLDFSSDLEKRHKIMSHKPVALL